MPNPFVDQEKFMTACSQTVDAFNKNQYEMYKDLVSEEYTELLDAIDWEGELDALIDILVVTIGAILSMGVNPADAWDEVMKTNFAKIDPETGKVRKRADGKVLKNPDWIPPNLGPFVKHIAG